MNRSSAYFVGLDSEVQHHAAPFADRLSLKIVPPEEVVRVAQPGDIAIFYSEHFDRFRHAIHCLKQHQVATLYLVDGILEWRNAWENRPDEPACPFTMRPVLCHKVACIGPSQVRALGHWGNAGKTELTGIPRFDRLAGLQTSRRNSDDPFRILVMTAKFPGFTSEQMDRTKQSLLDLKHWFERNTSLIVQHQKRELKVGWRLTGELDRELGVTNELNDLSGTELIDQLLHSDAVISTPSTAMLEAMVLGLPVASLDYHPGPSYLQTAWTIDRHEVIGSVVQELIHPPEPKMHFQSMQLHDALVFAPHGPSNNVTTATDRLVDLVSEMQKIASEHIASQQLLSFPDRILPPLQNAIVPFNHSKMYPLRDEFREDNQVLLQSELAHARREIEFLQRELAQAKSELKQAHTIFEQIHQHPVAGPIVRMRQKFIDWFASRESASRESQRFARDRRNI